MGGIPDGTAAGIETVAIFHVLGEVGRRRLPLALARPEQVRERLFSDARERVVYATTTAPQRRATRATRE
jgi:hypothetical protein